MIEKLTIRNFKSVKDLELDCRRINLFIGEPNTGKSNILESLGLLSWAGHGADINRIHRKDIRHEGGRSRVVARVEQYENTIGLIDENPDCPQPEELQRYVKKNTSPTVTQGLSLPISCPSPL